MLVWLYKRLNVKKGKGKSIYGTQFSSLCVVLILLPIISREIYSSVGHVFI